MPKNSLQNFLMVVLVGCVMICDRAFADDNSVEKTSVALFAGGCFWCMEPPFEALPGVIKVISGYTGGHTQNPTYKEVSNDKTGHLEAVEITYDPAKVSYGQLLDVFWHNVDPFDDSGQFCDKGDQYKAAIFYRDDREKQLAETSKIAIEKKLNNKVIVTTIRPAGQFFPAEDYHQDYYLKNPIKYKFYRFSCGRDHRLSEIWN